MSNHIILPDSVNFTSNELTSDYDAKRNLARIQELQTIIPKCKSALAKCPAGHLKAAPHGNKWEYYQRKTSLDHWEYIRSKNFSTAQKLGQKVYLKRVIASAENELNARISLATSLEHGSIESLYQSMPQSYHPIVRPINETSQMFYERWMNEKYEPGYFKPDDKVFYSKKGEKMRSRAETSIADALYDSGIPYRYEKPLLLKGCSNPIRPDFTLLDFVRRIEIFWEYLGMMDNPHYARTFQMKFNLYIANDIFPGNRLILSGETSSTPYDRRITDKVISRLSMCVLPGNLR